MFKDEDIKEFADSDKLVGFEGNFAKIYSFENGYYLEILPKKIKISNENKSKLQYVGTNMRTVEKLNDDGKSKNVSVEFYKDFFDTREEAEKIDGKK